MIKTQYQVPEVYYNESRDFQVLGRTYDIVFNYLKNNINSIYHNPLSKSSDKVLLDILSYTLGFEPKHNYNVNQLYSVCSSLSEILKNKGSKKSIELLVYAILNSQGINREAMVQISEDDPYFIKIFISSELADTVLLEDLLDYIIPAGMSYTVIQSIILNNSNTYGTKIKTITDSYIKTYHTTSDSDSGLYTKVNYVAKKPTYGTIYTNLIGPGMIDNITVMAKSDVNTKNEE